MATSSSQRLTVHDDDQVQTSYCPRLHLQSIFFSLIRAIFKFFCENHHALSQGLKLFPSLFFRNRSRTGYTQTEIPSVILNIKIIVNIKIPWLGISSQNPNVIMNTIKTNIIWENDSTKSKNKIKIVWSTLINYSNNNIE